MFFSLSALLTSKKYLILGIIFEFIIFGSVYLFTFDMGETFRLAARYSGRLSLLVFLLPFAFYLQNQLGENDQRSLFAGLRVFAILHTIHFGFLTANVVWNAIPLVPVKLTGGALAYLMILCLPFFENKIKAYKWLLSLYFFYVGVVMSVTYLSRIKGDFEGSESSPIHYLALGVLGLFLLVFLRQLINRIRS